MYLEVMVKKSVSRVTGTALAAGLAWGMLPAATAEDHVMAPGDVPGEPMGPSGMTRGEETGALVWLIQQRNNAVGTREFVDCTTLPPHRMVPCGLFSLVAPLVVAFPGPTADVVGPSSRLSS